MGPCGAEQGLGTLALRAAPTPAPCPDPRESSGCHSPRNRRHGLKISQAGVRVGTFCSQWDQGQGLGMGERRFWLLQMDGSPETGPFSLLWGPWGALLLGRVCFSLFICISSDFHGVCLPVVFPPRLAARQQHSAGLGELPALAGGKLRQGAKAPSPGQVLTSPAGCNSRFCQFCPKF